MKAGSGSACDTHMLKILLVAAPTESTLGPVFDLIPTATCTLFRVFPDASLPSFRFWFARDKTRREDDFADSPINNRFLPQLLTLVDNRID